MKKRYLTPKTYKKAPVKKVVYEEMKKEEKKREFPSISRFIPELLKVSSGIKIFLILCIFTLVVTISSLVYLLGKTSVSYALALSKREAIEKQYDYWKEVSQTHPSYRDAYFMLALLSYKLGEERKTKEYLHEVYLLDPTYKQGKEFADKTNIQWE